MEKKSETGKNVCLALLGVFGFIVACVIYGTLRGVWYNGQDAWGLWSVFFWVIPCATATIIGASKHRGVFGFVLGFLFSWLGVVVIGVFASRRVD